MSKAIACPQCGSTTWHRIEDYAGSDYVEIHTADPRLAHRRDGLKYDAYMDSWSCENNHSAPDDDRIQEALDNWAV